MTLIEYLGSIKPDYTDETLSMIFTKGNVTNYQFEESRGRPFIQVVEGKVRVSKRYQQALVFEKIVTVRIYQSANTDGTAPSYAKITNVVNEVLKAPTFIDENTYGDNLIRVKCIGGFSPHHDTDSGGVAAEVTFLVEFGREF